MQYRYQLLTTVTVEGDPSERSPSGRAIARRVHDCLNEAQLVNTVEALTSVAITMTLDAPDPSPLKRRSART